ncbi:hypothetical protein D0T11_05345 [Hymenobacter rubripertinctus]|uniref:Uncharacterized protein n=2 Tax=Hymenobacter rubripertinctus TaxID=2029981 RepID=A0A418R4V0_9BACT|nr:hypothetical protein D0T11_05345 [Hymenobacter rubripertinctus]
MDTTTDPPRLLIEQPPHDEAEAALLAKLTETLTITGPLSDLRDLAPDVRRLFPGPDYLVGCGGAHVWLHRVADSQRLAIIR